MSLDISAADLLTQRMSGSKRSEGSVFDETNHGDQEISVVPGAPAIAANKATDTTSAIKNMNNVPNSAQPKDSALRDNTPAKPDVDRDLFVDLTRENSSDAAHSDVQKHMGANTDKPSIVSPLGTKTAPIADSTTVKAKHDLVLYLNEKHYSYHTPKRNKTNDCQSSLQNNVFETPIALDDSDVHEPTTKGNKLAKSPEQDKASGDVAAANAKKTTLEMDDNQKLPAIPDDFFSTQEEEIDLQKNIGSDNKESTHRTSNPSVQNYGTHEICTPFDLDHERAYHTDNADIPGGDDIAHQADRFSYEESREATTQHFDRTFKVYAELIHGPFELYTIENAYGISANLDPILRDIKAKGKFSTRLQFLMTAVRSATKNSSERMVDNTGECPKNKRVIVRYVQSSTKYSRKHCAWQLAHFFNNVYWSNPPKSTVEEDDTGKHLQWEKNAKEKKRQYIVPMYFDRTLDDLAKPSHHLVTTTVVFIIKCTFKGAAKRDWASKYPCIAKRMFDKPFPEIAKRELGYHDSL